MVPPSGTREKSPGPGSSFACLKLKCAPAPHKVCGMRRHPAQISLLGRRGLRGNMVPTSNRARPAVRCRTAFPQKCRDCGGLGSTPLGEEKTRPLGAEKSLGRFAAKQRVALPRWNRALRAGVGSSLPAGITKRALAEASALSCRVFTEKMQTCSHCSTIVFKINLEDIGPLLCHQRLFHLVVRRQFWILNVHCHI